MFLKGEMVVVVNANNQAIIGTVVEEFLLDNMETGNKEVRVKIEYEVDGGKYQMCPPIDRVGKMASTFRTQIKSFFREIK